MSFNSKTDFIDIGKVNYLGQPIINRVIHCQGVPQIIVTSKSKTRSN